MKHGDFSELAKQYINRPGYSKQVLTTILKYMDYKDKKNFQILDLGAGTGKLTKEILEMGFENLIAVEPNIHMKEEGMKYTKEYKVQWFSGSAEETGMESNIADWVLMGSSFHWTEPSKSLPEIARILKTEGYFTAIWNPRNIDTSELHSNIEEIIYNYVPNLKRVSSGSSKNLGDIEDTLLSTGNFGEVIFIEASHNVVMTKDRYMGAWKSVNDIRVQAGEEKWNKILAEIENEIIDLTEIVVPYKSRSWTAKKIK